AINPHDPVVLGQIGDPDALLVGQPQCLHEVLLSLNTNIFAYFGRRRPGKSRKVRGVSVETRGRCPSKLLGGVIRALPSVRRGSRLGHPNKWGRVAQTTGPLD